ncbi:MAG: PepSY domain-containing protein [Eubacteriales bacterium]
MNKKTIGLCIGLCATTACLTAVASVGYVTSEFRPTTSTTAATVTSNASEATSGTTESATTILLPTTDSATTVDSTTNNTTTPSTTTTDSYIGEAKAKEIALAHAGLNESDVQFAYCQLDFDDGRYEYEVEFYYGTTEYDYDILATTGEILSYDFDMEHPNTSLAPVASDTTAQSSTTTDVATATPSTTTTDSYIGEAKAKEIALAHAGISETDTTGLRCQLDYDDGYYEYEVDWNVGRTEYEYTILATNGTILEFDIDVD